MNKTRLVIFFSTLCFLFFTVTSGTAADLKSIQLVKPQMDGGRLLMHVLKERKSSRDFSEKKLPIRVLSNLFWAASGINRIGTSKRTVPSTMNWQEIDIYVATKEGLYLYDSQQHRLEPILKQDIRALTGTQTYVADAPVNLVYVADFARMGNAVRESKDFYAAVDTGFIVQNVYLYCASEGLATIVRAMIDRVPLAQAMQLRPEQRIILAQTVGYPRR